MCLSTRTTDKTLFVGPQLGISIRLGVEGKQRQAQILTQHQPGQTQSQLMSIFIGSRTARW